jgi:hypothetical protein
MYMQHTTAMYMQRTTSGAAGNGLYTTMKYMRRTTSAAANNGLGTTIKYLVNLKRVRVTTTNNYTTTQLH